MGSKNFSLKPLKDVVDIFDKMRVPITKANRKSGLYPYYGASGIADYIDSYIFDGEYLLLSEDGDNLKTLKTPIAFLATGKFWVNNHAHILKANKDNDTKYLCYALQIADVKSYLSGSTRPKLTQEDMKKIPIFAPSLSEQRSIAHILGSLDDKIELNRKMNKTLEAMAQALFKSWFVDFDPVIDNALAEGKSIPEELKARAEIRKSLGDARKPLPEEVRALFPSEFVKTEEMGWIPKGWFFEQISKLAVLNPEAWSSKNSPQFIDYIDLANVKNGSINQVVGYKFSDAPSRARRILRTGDTIIGTVRPSNRSFAYIHHEDLTSSTGFAVMRPKEISYRAFIYICLTQNEVIEKFSHLADGAAYPAIRPEVVAGYKCIFPTKDILSIFNKFAYPWIRAFSENNIQNESLSKIRDTLIPILISGTM